MEKHEVVFDIVEPKKHSIRYRIKQEDTAVSDIYIYRSHLGVPVPKKIKITIEEVD